MTCCLSFELTFVNIVETLSWTQQLLRGIRAFRKFADIFSQNTFKFSWNALLRLFCTGDDTALGFPPLSSNLQPLSSTLLVDFLGVSLAVISCPLIYSQILNKEGSKIVFLF